MFKRTLFLKNLSVPVQIMMLLMFIIISGFIISIIGILITIPFGGNNLLTNGKEFDILSNINISKFLQIVNHLGLFLIPSLLFVYLLSRNPKGYLKLDKKPHIFSLIAGLLLMLISMPFINWLLSINQSFHLPESMSGIENWMRVSEERAAYLTDVFLNVNTISGLLLNILMIAVIPAIGEEILFRGILMKLLKNWFGNIHIAIIISAVVFSAAHLQFFGFLPRVVLGLILGYLFYITRNLWIAIAAHFANNAFAVIVAFLNFKYKLSSDIEKFGSNNDDYPVIIFSLLLTIVIIFSINQRERKFKAISFRKTKEEEF